MCANECVCLCSMYVYVLVCMCAAATHYGLHEKFPLVREEFSSMLLGDCFVRHEPERVLRWAAPCVGAGWLSW